MVLGFWGFGPVLGGFCGSFGGSWGSWGFVSFGGLCFVVFSFLGGRGGGEVGGGGLFWVLF